jgi:uncharacterized protein (TIGR03435 family)
MRSCAVVAGAVLGLCVAGNDLAMLAQAPPAAPATFEVASVKPNKDGGPSSVRLSPGGLVTVTNNNLRNIIRNAFGITNAQIVGGPAWIDEDRFDITARGTGQFAQREAMVMMQALLAERFSLRTHSERREMPAYALVLARRDGALGPQMKKADVDCQALFAAVTAGGKMPERGPNGNLPCAISVRPAQGVITGSAVAMEQLARNLVGGVGRIVVDKTGLAGVYDIHVTFSPEPGQPLPPGAPAPQADLSAPSLFTALQEQLGLKLEPGQEPIEVLVIDRVERPAAD